MMKRKARSKEELSLTPMIDVVFLLLIFFIATLAPRDILSAPSIVRAAPNTKVIDVQPQLFKITVAPDGYHIDGTVFRGEAGVQSLRSHLQELSRFDSKLHVTIICQERARHEQLVRLLDLCYEAGLDQLALMTG